MTLIGGIVGLFMLLAALVGVGLIALGIAIWWPITFGILLLVLWLWRVWVKTGTEDHAARYLPPPPPDPKKISVTPDRKIRHTIRQDDWIENPNLPSSLD